MRAWPSDGGLFVQLKSLAQYIEQTRREISAIRPDEVNAQFIPTAKDELDAIVEATAAATNSIMDAAEVLMDISSRAAGEDATKGNAAVMAIFEACTFQDITGQRITKVIKTLQTIQHRLDLLITSDRDAGTGADKAPAPASVTGDAALLNGPALPGQGQSQQDIDALLSDMQSAAALGSK